MTPVRLKNVVKNGMFCNVHETSWNAWISWDEYTCKITYFKGAISSF